ncbi:MAG TPA: hypothetical protein VGE52_19495 [Pirellulales bacterium]
MAGFVVLGVAAFLVRIAAVALLWSSSPDGPTTYEHGAIAENLLAGKGFSVWYLGSEGPTSQQAPLYPFALAGLYALFGLHSSAALLVMQLLQCAAGAGVALLTAAAARRFVPEARSVGWAAGWIAALYPPHIYAATHIQVVVWATLALAALVFLVARPAQAPTRGRVLLLGTLSGALLLIEPILALALPLIALRFFQQAVSRDEASEASDARPVGYALALRQTVAFASVAALVVAPWIVRNAIVHGEFVFVKSSFGYAFWQGNNPQSWGTDKIPKASATQIAATHDGSLAGQNAALWNARHETLYIDDVLLKPTGYAEFQGLTEPQRSRLLGDRAWAFIADRPEEYLRLCGQRASYFLLFDKTNPKASHKLYQWSTITWFTLSTIGLALAITGPLARRLWLTYAIFGAVTLFHVLTITSARFRIPIEPLSFVWAGLAIGPLVARWLPELNLSAEAPAETTRREVAGLSPAHDSLQGPHVRPHVPARRRAAVPARAKRRAG